MDESYLSWLRLIPGVSSDLARRIAERYPDPELLKGASPANMSKVSGITEDVASRVLDLVRAASTSDASWYREEPALYLCPECGSFVGKGANACPFCGVVFDEGEASSESPVEELLRARNGEAKICTKCGAFLEPGATVCGMCGSEYVAERLGELPAVDTTPIPEADLFLCPHCGAFLSHGDAACAICGTPVDAEKRIPGLAREGRGVSKDFLSRWERVTSEETLTAPSPLAPRSLEDELQEYERLLEADPSLERAWLHKGRILIRLGRSTEAIGCFDRAARIDPENEDAYRAEVIGLLGHAADLSVLPPRWREAEPEVHDILDDVEERPRPGPAPPRPAPEPTRVSAKTEQRAPAVVAPPTPTPTSKPAPAVAPSPEPVSTELPAIRRAIAYYDRLLAMDSGLRVAWQTKGELLQRIGRKEDAEACFQRAADLEVAEREFGRTALTGLQTRGPVRAAPAQGTAPTGRTNGRVNGLTNGRHGRTNGRVSGLTNGSGATNGLTNGLGRVNGLMSGLARGEGRTNGLVNGNGFTNGRRGRPSARLPSAGREWARSVAGIAGVILLMVLAPILVSMLTTPSVTRGIVIDGSFGDWNRVPITYVDPVGATRGNPDVDLTSYKIEANPLGIDVYARVNGTAFRGAGSGADIVVALVDSDGNPNTGYDPGRLGANYVVEIVGWDSGVRESTLYSWRGGVSGTDWSGFQPGGSAQAASAGGEVEFSAGIDVRPNARVLVAAVDGAGRQDLANAIVIPGTGALSVQERTIAPDVITTATAVGVLRLDLTPVGIPVPVTALNVTKRGSLADSAVSLSLYEDNGDGVFTSADAFLGTSAVALARASFPLSMTLSGPATWFVAADLGALPANETFGLALRDVAARAPVTLASTDVTLSYLAMTPQPTVDGAFGDWTAIPRTSDPLGDVVNRTDVSAVVNGNVDLTEVATFLATNASFYLRVDGTILGGVEVPNLRARTPPQGATDSDLDSVPDNVEANLGPGLAADFNNDNVTDVNSNGDVDQDGVLDWPAGPDLWLNTTIPAWYPAPYAGRAVSRYIGPVSATPEPGVDTAYVYVDRDNRSNTGLFTYVDGIPHGMDYVYQPLGRDGTNLESHYTGYNG